MNEKRLAKLESQLEQLIEGTFANLFRKRISAHDLAMKLARSMEDALRYIQDGDSRPLAPDSYVIHLHSELARKIRENNPQLVRALAQHIVELVSQLGYRLNAEPVVQIRGTDTLERGEIAVEAVHTKDSNNSTAAMQPIQIEARKRPKNPHLIINSQQVVTLGEPLLNIGRSTDNHIVVDDPTCSRHHLQLRLRFGVYTLFDVNSRAGTKVNDVRVSEHQLQSGDVIKIGNTQMTYIVEDTSSGKDTTQLIDSV